MRAFIVVLALALGACKAPPTAAGARTGDTRQAEICNNGKDDDLDELVDCRDGDCADRCPRCGDGYIQEPEACEGVDVQGKTCQGLGFQGGLLVCSAECQVDTAGCFYPGEDCGSPGDEDHDGVADCADPDCGREAACLSLRLVSAPATGFVTEDLSGTPIVLEVLGGGKGRAGIAVALAAPPGAGGTTRSAVTGASGRVSLPVWLGRQAGPAVFVASIEGAPPVEITIRAIDPEPGVIHTIVNVERKDGTDVSGPAVTARIQSPIDLAVADDASLFVAEPCRILRVSPEGELSVVAGTASCGDPGPTLEPGDPITVTGIALAATGDRLYFGSMSSGTGKVWAIDLASGAGSVVAGGGDLPPGSAEGGPATSARLGTISRVRIDPGAALHVVDVDVDRILRVDLTTGLLRTWMSALGPDDEDRCAGEIALRSAADVVFDAEGRGFVSGSICGTACFNAWADGTVPGDVAGILRVPTLGRTAAPEEAVHVGGRLAGSTPGESPAWLVAMPTPPGAVFDVAGNLLAVTGHSLVRIDGATHGVQLLGAGPEEGFSGELVSASFARYARPQAVAIGPGGDLYVADTGNRTVRRIVALGRRDATGLSIVQQGAPPSAIVAQRLPALPGGDTVRVLVQDDAGVPLPFRRLEVASPAFTVPDPRPVADRRGIAELLVQAPLVTGEVVLSLSTSDLHGAPIGPFEARFEVVEPEPGMIFAPVSRDRNSSEHPDGPLFGPTAGLNVVDFALASDGRVFVATECRIYEMDASGTMEVLAGTGTCDIDGDGGSAVDVPVWVSDVELDGSTDRLLFWRYGAVNGRQPLRAIDLASGKVELVMDPLLPVHVATDGEVYAARQNGLGTFDVLAAAFTPLFGFPPGGCAGKADGQLDDLSWPLDVQGDDFLFRARFCGPDEWGAARRDADGTFSTIVRLTADGTTEEGEEAIGAGGQVLWGLSIDPEGRLVYADPARVRRVEDGKVYTIAGRPGSPARDHVSATLSRTSGARNLRHDAGGHLWFVDEDGVRVVW